MKLSGNHVRDGYIRVVAAVYTAIGGLIATLATVILLAAVMDHFLSLGWGLDYKHAWILLIVISTCSFLLVIGRAIFRMMGAVR